jgi:hypothetical protein
MKRYRDNSVRSIPWWAAALANVQDLKKHEKEFQDVEVQAAQRHQGLLDSRLLPEQFLGDDEPNE